MSADGLPSIAETSATSQPERGPRVVVLGGGYAGAYATRNLEKTLAGLKASITLIDRHNYFVIFPLLIEAGTGSLEPRHTVVSLRSFVRTAMIRMAEVVGVDLKARIVYTRIVETGEEEAVPYDHLVVALGSVTRLPDVPGLAEHGFELKSLADAVSLRDRAIRLLEAADATDDPLLRRALLHMVIVGANFTGVELAGEFHEFLQRAARKYRRLLPKDCTITLVEHGRRILPALDEDLARYAEERLRRRGVNIILQRSVTHITDAGATLTDGSRLAAHTVVWTAGIQPNPIVKRLGLPVDDRGWIRATRELRIEGLENVWAIGDCAAIPDGQAAAGGAAGGRYPATAQHASRQGIHLAGNIAAVCRGLHAAPCDITHVGSLAALGCRTGVAKLFGIKVSGFAAWWLWRTVYLLKMPGLGRKFRVAIDWTLDMVFPRDDVQLGVHRRSTLADQHVSVPSMNAAAVGHTGGASLTELPTREASPSAH